MVKYLETLLQLLFSKILLLFLARTIDQIINNICINLQRKEKRKFTQKSLFTFLVVINK